MIKIFGGICMTISEVPGVQEKVEAAVKPLTEHGDFYLAGITHDGYYGDLKVLLTSKEFNITFHTLLKAPKVFSCSFIVNSVNKHFSAEFLFPACHIDIPLRTEHPLTDIDYGVLRDRYNNREKENEILLERSKFIPEIHRLSNEIIKILPILDDLFISSNINKTWELYLAESRKRKLN